MNATPNDTSSLDDIITISCGPCGKKSPFYQWVKDLPHGTHKCPQCGYTFERKLIKDRYNMDKIILERILL